VYYKLKGWNNLKATMTANQKLNII